jgi:hypothetical protein
MPKFRRSGSASGGAAPQIVEREHGYAAALGLDPAKAPHGLQSLDDGVA